MTTARKAATPAQAAPPTTNGKGRVAVKPAAAIPAGRLLELLLETALPAPYVVTNTITITPPTKARADAMRQAQMSMMVYQTLLNERMNSGQAGEDELTGLSKFIEKSQNDYNEAFFADQYEAVVAFFDTQDDKLWLAFEKDIQAQFFPAQPADGACPSCGHITDEDAAAKN